MEVTHYATKKSGAYEIRFLKKEAPLRNTWFIFEVTSLPDRENSERGISFGRQFMKLIEDKKDVSENRLCKLALLRLKIALERGEPDITANRPRPPMDYGYDLYDASSTDQPVSMAAETRKFEKMLRKAHRNPDAPVERPQPPTFRSGAGCRSRRWGAR